MTYLSQTLPHQQHSCAFFFRQLGATGRKITNEFIGRQKMKASLGRLSARDLRDIGLTRNDITSISSLSLAAGGALELAQAAKSRSGNW